MWNENYVLGLYVLFSSILNYEVSSLKIPGVKISCSPRSFSVTAPCQATCTKAKPKLCIKKPGCYCANGIFDPIAKACVEPDKCSPQSKIVKESKSSGSASGSGGFSASIGGSGSGESSGSGKGKGGVHASVSISGGGGISGAIKSIIGLPVKVGKGLIHLGVMFGIKEPVMFGEKGVNLGEAATQMASKITARSVGQMVSLTEGLAGKMGSLLVSVGVLQGQSVEDVVTFIQGLAAKMVQVGMESEIKISDGITGSIGKVGSTLQLSTIRKRIENLPVVKSGVKFVGKIRMTIHTRYQDQIDELEFYLKNQVNQHAEFFDPIMNRVSSSILIMFNSFNAMVDGRLNECPGMDGPDKSPVGSLQRKLHIYIDEVKVFIFKRIGFKGTAEKSEAELKEEEAQPPPAQTMMPPIARADGPKHGKKSAGSSSHHGISESTHGSISVQDSSAPGSSDHKKRFEKSQNQGTASISGKESIAGSSPNGGSEKNHGSVGSLSHKGASGSMHGVGSIDGSSRIKLPGLLHILGSGSIHVGGSIGVSSDRGGSDKSRSGGSDETHGKGSLSIHDRDSISSLSNNENSKESHEQKAGSNSGSDSVKGALSGSGISSSWLDSTSSSGWVKGKPFRVGLHRNSIRVL